jgi:hypothetical protein
MGTSPSDYVSTKIKEDFAFKNQNSSNNIKKGRTQVLYRQETIDGAILQFIKNANHRWDIYAISTARPQLTRYKQMQKESIKFMKERGGAIRYITEITEENLEYCKELMKTTTELRHLPSVKGNSQVSDSEYQATADLQVSQPLPLLIYSNDREVVRQQQYVFETLWNIATPADQRMKQLLSQGSVKEDTVRKIQIWTDKDRRSYAIKLEGDPRILASTSADEGELGSKEHGTLLEESELLAGIEYNWDYTLRHWMQINNIEPTRTTSTDVVSGLVEDASNSSSKGIIDREVNKRLAMKKDIRAESSNKFFRKDKSTTKSKIKLKCHYCNLVFDSRAQRLLHEQAWHQTR